MYHLLEHQENVHFTTQRIYVLVMTFRRSGNNSTADLLD